jgi:hypothetical protein
VRKPEVTLGIARQRAEELGIKTILITSTKGDTTIKAVELLKGPRVITISHTTSSRVPNIQKFTEEKRKKVGSKGCSVLTTTHAFTRVNRILRPKYETMVIGKIITNVLCVFGHGMKLIGEIALMITSNGPVPTDKGVIAIKGSRRGADTSIVL